MGDHFQHTFDVGQWVTCETANGYVWRGKVVERSETRGGTTITYTLRQYPDEYPAGYPELGG